MASSLRRALPRTLILGTLLVLAAALPASASAQVLVNNFEGGDGDQAAPALCAQVDWQCLTGAAVPLTDDDPGGPSDDVFGGGSKENEPNSWTFTTAGLSGIPSKSDIRAAWSARSETATGSFIALAFKREGNSGDTFLTFELNQSRNTWTNASGATIPCRTDGDVLISYEVPSGTPVVKVYGWNGSGGSASCPDGGIGTFTDGGVLGVSLNSVGAMNFANDITNYLSPGVYGSSFAAGTFGEAAVSMRAIADALQTPCQYFKQLQVHSRSSNSTSASLQDHLLAKSFSTYSCPTGSTPDPDQTGGGVGDTGTGGTGGSGTGGTGGSGGDGTGGWTGGTTDGTGGTGGTGGSGDTGGTTDTTGATGTTGTTGTGGTGGTTLVGGTLTGDPDTIGVLDASVGSLNGPKGCALRTFRASIKVKGAKRVAFLVDGKVVKTLKRTKKRGRWSTVLNVSKLRTGKHTLSVKITFKKKGKKAAIRKLAFKKCSTRCSTARSLRLRVPRIKGMTPASAKVFVASRLRKKLSGAALGKPVRITKLPTRRFKVTFEVTTTDGKTYTRSRMIFPCKKRGGSSRRDRR